jgi:DNA-3-methyladenine glycosylase II
VALLPIPGPYSFELSTERFRAFGPDLANLWHEGGLHRVVDGREVRIEAAPGGVDVEPLDAATEPVVRKLLGLEFDLEAFARFAAAETVLGPVVLRLAGLRPSIAPDPLEALVSAITAQQVSLFAAFAIRNRLVEAYGVKGNHAYAFPTAAQLAQAEEADLVALGFSRRKAEYVLTLARAQPDWHELSRLPDEDVKERITALRGLGEWTADWFLARHLGRARGWPAGDLGLRKAVSAFYADGRLLSIEEVRALGPRFDPFQNLTAHYLLVGLRIPG